MQCGFDEEHVARLLPERVWLRKTRGKKERCSVELHGRLSFLQTTNSIGARIPEQEVLSSLFGHGGKLCDTGVNHENNEN